VLQLHFPRACVCPRCDPLAISVSYLSASFGRFIFLYRYDRNPTTITTSEFWEEASASSSPSILNRENTDFSDNYFFNYSSIDNDKEFETKPKRKYSFTNALVSMLMILMMLSLISVLMIC
jgi:hypothetical protein